MNDKTMVEFHIVHHAILELSNLIPIKPHVLNVHLDLSLISKLKNAANAPPGEVAIGSGCGKCPPGKQYLMKRFECIACLSGKFKATEGQKKCQKCPSGTFADSGAAECTRCPPGQALMGRGKNATCSSCPPGTSYAPTRFRCEICRVGTFQPNENISPKCITCAGNAFSAKGSAECTTCPRNEVLLRNGKCASCAVNSFYNFLLLACFPCAFNRFSLGGAATYCGTCPIGAIVNESGSCDLCPPGQAAMRNGKCDSCPPGRSYDAYHGICERCIGSTIQPRANIDEYCQPCPSETNANRANTKCID